MAPQTFGIVGYGHFGSFLAHSLAEHGREVLVTDADTGRLPTTSDGVRPATIAEIAHADVAVIAVPFASFEPAVTELRRHLVDDTVVMDVVSIKARATDLLETILAGHPNVIASHPLFGPPSMPRIEPGNRIVITRQAGPRAADLRAYLEDDLQLVVLDRDASEHDRTMAYMQALPFFIARALSELDLPPDDLLAIPSYEKLVLIAGIEEHHTQEMFDTSQLANPYAAAVRREFLEALMKLDADINQRDPSNPLPTDLDI
jgi:prephenate dehydrogenase